MSQQPKFCEGGRMGFNCIANASSRTGDNIDHHFRCPKSRGRCIYCDKEVGDHDERGCCKAATGEHGGNR